MSLGPSSVVPARIVIPAKAGIHGGPGKMDPGFRRDDERGTTLDSRFRGGDAGVTNEG